MILNKIFRSSVIFILLFMVKPADASAWFFNAGASLTSGQYQNSELRKEAFSSSVKIGANYLEHWGVNIRAAYSSFVFKKSKNINQYEYGLQLYKNIFSDFANGTFSLLLGNYWITGANIETTMAFYPEVIYLNNSKSLLLGLGYAYSRYGSSNNPLFHVKQLTVTFGFSPISKTLWFNFKNYYIFYEEKAQYSSQATISWNIPGGNQIVPSTLTFGGLIGKRSYAVEQETMLTYNTADEQQGSFFTSAQWRLNDNSFFGITIGTEIFNEETTNKNYQYNFINGGVSVIW